MQCMNIPLRIFIQCVEFLTDSTDLLGLIFDHRTNQAVKKFNKIRNIIPHRQLTTHDEKSSNPHGNKFAYIEVDSLDDMMSLLKFANKLRTTCATKQNNTSSRQHFMVKIDILMNNKITTIDLFDLAGTESYDWSASSSLNTVDININNTELLHMVNQKIENKPIRLKNSIFTNMLKSHFIQGSQSKVMTVVHISLDIINSRNTNHFVAATAELIKLKSAVLKRQRRNSLI